MKRYSIIQPDLNECWFCHKREYLHKHEVFFGTANRKKSIKYGMVVALCPEHHNMSSQGVHHNRRRDLELKRYAQKVFEEKYGHEKFMEVFGKSYEDIHDGY